jgi:GT2 family glycosyltransferase
MVAERDDVESGAASVCVVTVTYGDRSDFCEACVDAAFAAGATAAVIVLNGASDDSAAQIRKWVCTLDCAVELVDLGQNRGSAAGFKAGIVAALSRVATESIWLLDDDNRAESSALIRLRAARQSLAALGDKDVAVSSYRVDRPRHQVLAAGGSPRFAYPRHDSYAGFHVADAVEKLVRRRTSRSGKPNSAGNDVRPPLEIPYGPYGGLLVTRAMVASIGYPNEAFDTYEDDAEYTRRLTNSGHRLFLVFDSEVSDLEASWYTTGRGRTPFSRQLLAYDARRLYLTVRNRIAFEERYWINSRLLRTFNAVVYWVGLVASAVAHRKIGRALLIARAARDGRKLQ